MKGDGKVLTRGPRAAGAIALHQKRNDPSQGVAVVSVAEKIGCASKTLDVWLKKTEVDSGKHAGAPTLVRTSSRR
jgi:transposase-like protein